ncbi:MAG TPA: HEAT repeat domain-containing protein [Terriglobales bacterium]|nr:HEAT repeat domain-containing protein [Terriglobales bacterium]
MADNKQIKNLGLRFARALQMTVKTAIMFTVNHKSVERPVQQSFEFLNALLKETGQFTFGFIDNQIILNNLLTTDPSLNHLQTEFLKRGIAAVTFEPGLTMGRYKKVLSLLAVSTKEIDDAGGTLAFIDQNEVEGARILPAAKNQKKDEDGDTIIDTDSEAYIMSKQMAEEQGSRDFMDSIDALLESGCIDPSVRAEVLTEFAGRPADGAGYGVPVPVPNLVPVREGQVLVDKAAGDLSSQAPQGGAGTGQGGSGSGGEGQVQSGTGGGGGTGAGGPAGAPGIGGGGVGSGGFRATGGGTSPGSGDGFGYGFGPGGSDGADGSATNGEFGVVGQRAHGRPEPGGGWRHAMGLQGAGSGSFMEMVEASVQRSLLEERGDPQKSYTSLARILRNMGVDKILANFPVERRQELNSLPPEQLAAEYIEDTALQLAGAKLKSAEGHSQKILIEEEVIHVLARSLKATHMADRLAQKLAKFISDFSVPPHLQEKMREELHWSTLNSTKRFERLMSLKHYSSVEFRRVIELAKELLKGRDNERAISLATHYFEFLDDDGQIEVTELSRAPELIRVIPLAHGDFANKTAVRLGKALLRENVSELIHMQAATALAVLAQAIASFESFSEVLTIGGLFEKSLNRDPEKHKKCCAGSLRRLLPAAAIERIVEIFLLQRESGGAKNAVTLLRFAAPASIESVFNHLIAETDARNRLALVRLIGQLGKGSIEVAYKYLKDERWYVVRNICGVLSELKDPDLAEHIVSALEHSDPRVQQAALKAIIHSRTVRAAPVLAASLIKLAPNVLDEALNELMFLRHVKSIEGLEKLIRSETCNLATAKKAIQVLATIDDDEALYTLARLLGEEKLDNQLRRAALHALSANRAETAKQVLKDFASTKSPLAEEVSAQLKKAAAAK